MLQGQQTNWCVITGAPSSGKSTLLDALAFRGFFVRPEAARILIDEQMSRGKTLGEIRADEEAFQQDGLRMKIEAENKADSKSLIFWERAIPDTIAYLEHIQGDSKIAQEASLIRTYRKVFLLDPLPLFETDYARVESKTQALEIYRALERTYFKLGYSMIKVPVLPISERVKLILDSLS